MCLYRRGWLRKASLSCGQLSRDCAEDRNGGTAKCWRKESADPGDSSESTHQAWLCHVGAAVCTNAGVIEGRSMQEAGSLYSAYQALSGLIGYLT